LNFSSLLILCASALSFLFLLPLHTATPNHWQNLLNLRYNLAG